jgi:hypothetical protein
MGGQAMTAKAVTQLSLEEVKALHLIVVSEMMALLGF